MTDGELPKSVRGMLYAQRHRLLNDDLGRAAARIAEAGIGDAFAESIIADRVRKHRIAQAFAGPFPMVALSRGNLVLGVDQRGRVLRFSLDTLLAHSLTLGGSGSGKTTRSRFLALQIVPRVRGAWLMDWRKTEFAALRPLLARMGIDLIVVPGRQLRFNPLQVPHGIEPAGWASRLADMLVGVLRLPPRATTLLHTTIIQLYDRWGVVVGGRSFPTLFDLREAVAADVATNAQARLSILDSLDRVLLSVGPVFRYRLGWTTRDLAQRRIVFELGNLAEADRDLIVNSLLLSEFASRVEQGVSNAAMSLWVCVDEAARLISASNPSGIADLLGLVRGTGIGVDLSTQTADIAAAVLSNTATKLCGRCGSALDYELMAGAMGLNAEQRAWIRTNLVPGLFVCQLAEGDWREPFLLRIPPMNIARVSAPGGASGDLGDLPALPAVPA